MYQSIDRNTSNSPREKYCQFSLCDTLKVNIFTQIQMGARTQRTHTRDKVAISITGGLDLERQKKRAGRGKSRKSEQNS